MDGKDAGALGGAIGPKCCVNAVPAVLLKCVQDPRIQR